MICHMQMDTQPSKEARAAGWNPAKNSYQWQLAEVPDDRSLATAPTRWMGMIKTPLSIGSWHDTPFQASVAISHHTHDFPSSYKCLLCV
jgi:hypothetical protein